MNPSREMISLIKEIRDLLRSASVSENRHSRVVDSDDSMDEPPRKMRCVSFNPLPEPAHGEQPSPHQDPTSMETDENSSEVSLASFQPNIGEVNELSTTPVENGTLGSVVLNPPTFGLVLRPLTEQQLAGFRLQPGPVTGQFLAKSDFNGNQGAGL